MTALNATARAGDPRCQGDPEEARALAGSIQPSESARPAALAPRTEADQRPQRRRGFLALDRDHLASDDPLWGEPREFSRFEAWLDLAGMAAWAPHQRLVGGVLVSLEVGEVPVSLRYLAGRWSWSKDRVRRFLAMLCRDLARLTRHRKLRECDTYLIVERGAYGEARDNGETPSATQERHRQDKEEEGESRRSSKMVLRPAGAQGGQASLVESKPPMAAKGRRRPPGTWPAIPTALDTPAFRAGWQDYQAVRREGGTPVGPTSAALLLKQCEEMGLAWSLAAIANSSRYGYKKLVHPDGDGGARGAGHRPSTVPLPTASAAHAAKILAAAKQQSIPARESTQP